MAGMMGIEWLGITRNHSSIPEPKDSRRAQDTAAAALVPSRAGETRWRDFPQYPPRPLNTTPIVFQMMAMSRNAFALRS